MARRNATGGYYQPTPLDLELLRRLPHEGSTLGFHNIGLTVNVLRESLNKGLPVEAHLTADQVSGRLRGMQAAGLTVDVTVMPVSKGRGWQRTVEGERFYREQTGEALPKNGGTTKLRAVADEPAAEEPAASEEDDEIEPDSATG